MLADFLSKRTRRTRPGGGEMPFFDHLEELRWRILYALLAATLGAALGLWLVIRFDVLGLLIDPIRPLLTDGRLHYLSPGDPFFLTLRLGITVGLLLASPILFYQIWAFVSPALLPREKRAIVPSLYLGLVLFSAGVALAYFYALPMTLRFFQGFQTESLQQMITAPAYLGFVIKLLIAFGVAFEVPVVVLVLASLGLVTSKFLAEKRRYAIGGMAILAALLTPGDVVTVTILMMAPLILLYELSILLARVIERRRAADVADEPSPIWGAGT